MIRITSKVDGFRRAGVAHTKAPVEHPDDAFTAAQLKALQAEPMLVVEVIDGTAGASKKSGGKPASKAA